MTFRRVAAALGLALGIALLYSPQLGAQAGVQGRWTTLPSLMPINPIHIAMMHNGKVLIVAGSGNVASETNYQAAVWDPESGSIITQPVAWDMFCNGMVILPDGRVFINGGNLQYDPFLGQPKQRGLQPDDRGLHERPEHGARPLVPDGHGARRRPRHDLLRTARNRRHEHRGGAPTRPASGGVRSTPPAGRHRSTRACTCCRTEPSSTRAPEPARASSTLRQRRGRASLRPRTTRVREPTERRCCCP